MSDTASEFDTLAAEAAEWGLADAHPPVRRATVPTPDGAVSAIVWGDRPEIVLLHGAGLNAHTWDGTLLALGRPAIAIDLPGHGLSDWREDFDYAPETIAPAVATAIRALAADALAAGRRLTVVGQSLGGLTAIALAASDPDLAGRLVVIDASPGIRRADATQVTDFLAGPAVFPSRDAIVEGALAAGLGGGRRSKVERGVLHNTRVLSDGSVVFRHHLANPPEGAAFAIDFTTLWPALEAVAVPLTLVRAARGFLPDDVVAEFRERAPRARVVEIDSGHNAQEERPVELAAIIAEAAGA